MLFLGLLAALVTATGLTLILAQFKRYTDAARAAQVRAVRISRRRRSRLDRGQPQQ